MPRIFRVGLNREFLDEDGRIAYGDIGLAPLDEAPTISYEFFPDRTRQLHPEHVAAYHGMILGGIYVDRSTFARGADELIVLSRHGVGYDTIDVAACTDNDVALCTTPKASRHPMASAAFAYVLALAKRLVDKDRLVRSGRWDRKPAYAGNEIFGKTLGIVGFGNIGSELARLAQPFAMCVLAHDPYARAEVARELGVELTSLDELMRRSDFVCVHAALTPQTRGLIGERELALMKPSAYFVNVARGPIVDQRALTTALRERRIAGAGLDVFEIEPLPLDDPLLELDNLLLAPHSAGHTHELSIAMGNVNAAHMLAVARGEPPEDVINRAVLERPGFQAKLARWRSA